MRAAERRRFAHENIHLLQREKRPARASTRTGPRSTAKGEAGPINVAADGQEDSWSPA